MDIWSISGLCFFAILNNVEQSCMFFCFMYLGIGLLGHRIYVCSAIVDTAKQLPKAVVPGYTPNQPVYQNLYCSKSLPNLASTVFYILTIVVSHCDL